MGLDSKIRLPNSADLFYPKEKEELKELMQRLQKEAISIEKKVRKIRAMVVPHAGYEFSGKVSAGLYSLIEGGEYKTVIAIGPSHHFPFRVAALDDADYWQTPLGKIEIDQNNHQKLLRDDNFQVMPMVFEKEHSLEVQLPWLQLVLGDFNFLPIVLGQKIDVAKIAVVLNEVLDENTLIVVSSDLSHYLSEDEARKIDAKTLENIVSGKSDGIIEACGKEGILILMELARLNNWQGEVIDYQTSGEVSGERESVVGYGGIIFS